MTTSQAVRQTVLGWILPLLMGFSYLGLAISLWDGYEMLMIGLAVCAVLRRDEGGDDICTALLAFITGAAPLIRLHQLIEGGCLLLFVLAYQRNKRNYWAMPLLSLITFAALWIYKGQSFAALPAFAVSSFEIMNGYTEAMAFIGPAWQVMLAVAALAVAAGLALWGCPLALPPVLLVGFLIFKHGVVRQDSHIVAFHMKIASLVLLVWAASMGLRGKPAAWWKWAVFALVTVVNLYLGVHIGTAIFPYVTENLQKRLSGEYATIFFPIYWNFDEYVARRARERAGELKASVIDAESKSRLGQATVDVLPNQIDLVPTNGLRWSPRPVFQSYSAYTPYLDAWNASHYAGTGSQKPPEKVILHWETVDGRNMMFDDPLTWREAFAHYQYESGLSLTGRPGWGLILSRRPGAGLNLKIEPIGDEIQANWEELINIPPRLDPAHEMIAMRVDIQPSLSGKLLRQALRGAPVYFEAAYPGNWGYTYRVVRANLASGPVVSPLPRNIQDMPGMFQGDLSGVASPFRLKFITPSPERFAGPIRVRFERLTFR